MGTARFASVTPKRLLLWLLLLFFFAVLQPLRAEAAALPRDLKGALPPEAWAELPAQDGDVLGAGSLLDGVEHMLAAARTRLHQALRSELGGAAALLGVILLCGAAEEVFRASSGERSRIAAAAGALAVLSVAAGDVSGMIGLGQRTLEEMDLFAKTLLPTLSAAVAAGGFAVTAGTGQVLTVYFTNTLITLIRHVLQPLVGVYIALSTADAVVPEHDLSGLCAGVRKAVTWSLTSLLAAYTALLTFTGAAASSADSLALRLTRSAISASVPVVGGIISDAADSVLASASILKNAVGVFGALGVTAICLTPFVRLGAQYLLYKLAAFLASVTGPKPLVTLANALGTAFGLILGMNGACVLMLLISIASSVKVVG